MRVRVRVRARVRVAPGGERGRACLSGRSAESASHRLRRAAPGQGERGSRSGLGLRVGVRVRVMVRVGVRVRGMAQTRETLRYTDEG